MWQGGSYGDPPAPIYNHDTRYFWLPESIRSRAQAWEYDTLNGHRSLDSTYNWIGHCNGVTCAQIKEPDPPTDCGALSQDDLEGLLAEIYMDCHLQPRTDTNYPSDMWLALREYLVVRPDKAPRVLAVDFDTETVWFWPVYGYRIDGDLIDDTTFSGSMTLYYEGHAYGVQHDSASAWYEFRCNVRADTDSLRPTERTGAWGTCHGPGGLTCPPDVFYTAESLYRQVIYRNPYVCDSTMAGYDRLKRVIDHKTIVLDDAYADTAMVNQWPGDSWVRRPGYADSCWAAYELWSNSQCWMYWSPRLGCDGLWSLYAWKTNPPGDGGYVDSLAHFVWGYFGYINQAVAPFDTWELVWGPWSCEAGTMTLSLDDFSREPDNFCWTYYDAFKLEWTPEGGDGGTSSSTVALGDGVQRVRVTPNPVRSNARISYTVPSPGRVHVVVYDVMGRAVLRASQDVQRAGLQNAPISLDGLPAGAYIARVDVGGECSTGRFVVCR